MEELDLFSRMNAIGEVQAYTSVLGVDEEYAAMISEHKTWLRSIRHERPSTRRKFKIGVYIRYFNQTKYEDYLNYHKKQFESTINLCPNWTLVDFYIDSGSSAPGMDHSPEWIRLLEDCMAGKVDLILTQKVSNVTKRIEEIILCSRLLAAQPHPIGIYFISEDLFTLASYYREDLKDVEFLPSPDWQLLPDDIAEGESRE